MSSITVNSHDILGKLSVVKNYVSVLLESDNLNDQQKDYLHRVERANQELIDLIKAETLKIKTLHVA